MTKFIFLLLSLAVLSLPIIFHSFKRILNGLNFKAALGASLIASILFSTIAAVLHMVGVIFYQEQANVALYFNDTPIEQYLINFGYSFAGISAYLYLNEVFPKNELQKYSLALSNLLIGLSIAFLFFAYPKWYTMVTCSTLVLALLFIEYLGKLRFMYRAYRAFAVSLLPFVIIYAVLFEEEIIKIASNQLTGMYLLYVPVEQYFLMLSTLLVAIYLFEFFKSKAKQ